MCYHPSFDVFARRNSFNLDFFRSCLFNLWKGRLSAWSPGTSDKTCLPYACTEVPLKIRLPYECTEGQAIPVKFNPEANKTYFYQPSGSCNLFRMS